MTSHLSTIIAVVDSPGSASPYLTVGPLLFPPPCPASIVSLLAPLTSLPTLPDSLNHFSATYFSSTFAPKHFPALLSQDPLPAHLSPLSCPGGGGAEQSTTAVCNSVHCPLQSLSLSCSGNRPMMQDEQGTGRSKERRAALEMGRLSSRTSEIQ